MPIHLELELSSEGSGPSIPPPDSTPAAKKPPPPSTPPPSEGEQGNSPDPAVPPSEDGESEQGNSPDLVTPPNGGDQGDSANQDAPPDGGSGGSQAPEPEPFPELDSVDLDFIPTMATQVKGSTDIIYWQERPIVLPPGHEWNGPERTVIVSQRVSDGDRAWRMNNPANLMDLPDHNFEGQIGSHTAAGSTLAVFRDFEAGKTAALRNIFSSSNAGDTIEQRIKEWPGYSDYYVEEEVAVTESGSPRLLNANERKSGDEQAVEPEIVTHRRLVTKEEQQERYWQGAKSVIEGLEGVTGDTVIKSYNEYMGNGGPDALDALIMEAVFRAIVRAENSEWSPGVVSPLTYYITPLVLDLDGNGVQTLPSDAGVMFDFDGDGVKEITGWVDPRDGLLALDNNSNGRIDDGSELFGFHTEIDGQKPGDGFLALKLYDKNNDGVIDNLDDVYSKLLVWVDSDSNGVSDSDELLSLSELDITSISLQSTTDVVAQNGNLLAEHGHFISEDGTRSDLVDVHFHVPDSQFTDKLQLALVGVPPESSETG